MLYSAVGNNRALFKNMRNLYINQFRKLKTKDKTHVRDICYNDLLVETITEMFKYNCDDEELKNNLNLSFEYFLRYYGAMGFFKLNDKLVFGRVNFIGKPIYNGFTEKVVITTYDGNTFEGVNGVDCAVVLNNKMAHSEIILQTLVEYLSEIDVSQWDLLINSRNHPIIICQDDETKKVITDCLENRKIGYTNTVASSGAILNNLSNKSGNGVDVITITDVNTAELFQYYEHHHKDTLERFYGMYGISTYNTSKMAQTNDLEISGAIASSLVIPISNYNCRLNGLEMVKKVFDIDISIEWGDIWKGQLKLLENIDKVENIDADESADGVPIPEGVKIEK